MGKRHPVGYYLDEWIIAHHRGFDNWTDFLDAYLSNFPGNKAAVKAHCKRSLGIDYPDQREDYDVEWITSNWEVEKNWKRLTEAYNETHGKSVSYGAMKSYCNRHLGLSFKYTDEQKEWLSENYPSIGKVEIAKRFNERFGTTRTANAVFVECKKLGLKVSDERRAIKRQMVAEIRKQPIGKISEREHGTLYIKTENGWKRCKELVMKRENGKLLIHLDGDKHNLNPENIVQISRKTSAIMTAEGFWSSNAEITKTGIEWSKLKIVLNEKGVDVNEFDYAGE